MNVCRKTCEVQQAARTIGEPLVPKQKGEEMIDKFVGSIRGIRKHRTGFDSYLSNIQAGRGRVGPTFDEARRDYHNTVRSEFQGYLR